MIESLKQNKNIDQASKDSILGCIPEIIDSANFVCEDTGIILRVEVYSPVLDSDDWRDFEDEEIQARYATYLSLVGNIDSGMLPAAPKTFDCLNILYRVLKGPIDDKDSNNEKTLKPENSPALKLNINLDLLPAKFLFEPMGTELKPPYFNSFGEYKDLGCEYFIRAIKEVLFVASTFAPNPTEFFKIQLQHTTNLRPVFELLKEYDVTHQLQNFDKYPENSYTTE
ncbi:unnamed protein product [Ambrosiozyma monospora]|uniref:Unnamed protein product n=1 Tax=Ambrosiozyma monospora TaxID=43982 RepID=A0ACB5U4H5_AMBMO|nr:unnamed protein product [Ambrosiozyma monospora]